VKNPAPATTRALAPAWDDPGERRLELLLGRDLDDHGLEAERLGGCRDVPDIHHRAGVRRVLEHSDDAGSGSNVVQQLDPLGRQLRAAEEGHPGEVSTRPLEARDQARLDGVPAGHEHDRHRRGSGLGRDRRALVAHDHGDLALDQVRHEAGEPAVLVVRVAVLDCDVLALDEAALLDTCAERRDEVGEGRGGRAPQEPDRRERRLRSGPASRREGRDRQQREDSPSRGQPGGGRGRHGGAL
jgi:hypothetical protein